MKQKLLISTKKVLKLLKYYLNQQNINIDDHSTIKVGGFYWTTGDNQKSKRYLPSTIRQKMSIGSPISLSLNHESSVALQEMLNNGFEPLFAMHHMHRALQESDPRAIWVEATIAAELAIKEVLVRKNPHIKILIEKLPSPPLEVLYKQVLKEYFGEESPYVKIIRDGANKRNTIVHNPFTNNISFIEAQE